MATRVAPPNQRPMPPDFPEMFARLGWDAIEDHYATGQLCVKRWMRECGEEEMIARRRAYLRKVYAAQGRSSIMGRRPRGVAEMSATDPGLMFMPVRRLRRRFEGEI